MRGTVGIVLGNDRVLRLGPVLSEPGDDGTTELLLALCLDGMARATDDDRLELAIRGVPPLAQHGRHVLDVDVLVLFGEEDEDGGLELAKRL